MSLFERFMPSWRYLITQIERHMHMPAALPKVWRLNYIILNAPGLSKPTDLEFPAVQIYEVRPSLCEHWQQGCAWWRLQQSGCMMSMTTAGTQGHL